MTTSLGERTHTRHGTRRADAKRTEARLRVVYPFDLRAVYPLVGDRLVIGRRPDDAAQPRLSHPTVSRHHLVIEWDERAGAHVGTDMGSRNGTWIDGSPAHGPRPLAANSVVRAGDVLLVYETGRGLSENDTAGVSLDAIPGEAPPVCLLRAAMARAARDPSPVLLIGETGTGKELIGSEIHRLSRREGELVTLNCAALSPHLVESQLFGHVRGAFTGAGETAPGVFRAANGGTLFLDEIGELPAALQPKLLRAIQEGEIQPVGSPKTVRVDVRVIAATNRDLAADVERGTFRRDLYARLALWELRVPALRERRGDLFDWIRRLHDKWIDRRSSSVETPAFEADAAEALLLHNWPENLRGVDRLVHELAGTGAAGTIPLAQLPAWLSAREDATSPRPRGEVPAPTPGQGRPPTPTKEELESVLTRLGGSVRATAKHFGRDRRQIYRWIEAFDLGHLRQKNEAP
jgi:transcriptional regulator with GAF, ATPase, and Fis domain